MPEPVHRTSSYDHVGIVARKFLPDLILFCFPASLCSSLESSSRSGSFQVHSASSPLVLSASNSASKGKSRKLASRNFLVLTARYFCRAWGVVPILLSEISPPAFRSTFPGVAYQLGNMVSSASAQIEASACISYDGWTVRTHLVHSTAGGEHSRTTIQGPNGPEDVPNYAQVQGIFIGVVAAYLIVMTLIGPENHGSHFERGKTAFQAGASKEDVNSTPDETEANRSSTGSGGYEKGETQHAEGGSRAKNDLV